MIMKGTVKWFNNQKGYGFIISEEKPGEDIFAHYSAISMDGYKTLKTGELVEFELTNADKGFHALNIKSLSTTNNVSTSKDLESIN